MVKFLSNRVEAVCAALVVEEVVLLRPAIALRRRYPVVVPVLKSALFMVGIFWVAWPEAKTHEVEETPATVVGALATLGAARVFATKHADARYLFICLCEEIGCRYLLFNYLINHPGVAAQLGGAQAAAALWVCILFSAGHMYQELVWLCVGSFALGVLQTVAFVRSRSLCLCTAMHYIIGATVFDLIAAP